MIELDERGRPAYRETIAMPAWVALLLVLLVVLCVLTLTAWRPELPAEPPLTRWIWDGTWGVTLLLSCVVPLCLGRMRISIEGESLVVAFGFLPGLEKRIPLDWIEGAEPVSYRPIRDFGGWGIRFGRVAGARTAVLSLRGHTGVLLRLRHSVQTLFFRSDQLLIGSLASERLALRLNA